MNAKEFLENQGIIMETTSLFTVIDGKVRQPDLCELMEKYADLETKEFLKRLQKTKGSAKKYDSRPPNYTQDTSF